MIPQQWQTLFRQTHGRERKNALQLLSEIVSDGNAELCDDVLSLAEENGRTDTDSIRQCYYLISKREFHPEPLRFQTAVPQFHYDPSLSAYDSLTGGDTYA